MGQHADRDQQFENIARLRQQYLESDNPILSIDTKKKELVGNFYREGHLYTQEVLATFDHDFPSTASGVVIPHGLYDLKRNDGHVNLGTSHDTGEFACDSIELVDRSGDEPVPSDLHPVVVRWRWQQQFQPVPV